VLKQRNQLLRTRSYKSIEAWNEQFLEKAAQLIRARSQYVKEIASFFKHYYLEISGSDESAHLCYHTQSLDEEDTPEVIKYKLRNALEQNSKLERERCMTVVGPHRDDLSFQLADKPIRLHGSQGQQKSYVLA
jgi:DNA replication and repair protein RecF